MAKPQAENGHIDIANEIAEALCHINLSPYEGRILWALFRKTYGWHKKTDHISYTQWEKLTGIARRHIGRTIKRLITRNIITSRGNGYHIEYGFQKNYELWDKETSGQAHSLPVGVTHKPLPVEGEPLPAGGKPLPVEVMQSLPVGVTTKETKETRQKKLDKRNYGEFNNVLLSENEYQKLIEKFGADKTSIMIEKLSEGIASKGYKYRSHYATILTWERNDNKQVLVVSKNILPSGKQLKEEWE